MKLQGKVALVTGGSRGIGAAIALKLASLGCHVAINYAGNVNKAEETLARIQSLGVAVSYTHLTLPTKRT